MQWASTAEEGLLQERGVNEEGLFQCLTMIIERHLQYLYEFNIKQSHITVIMENILLLIIGLLPLPSIAHHTLGQLFICGILQRVFSAAAADSVQYKDTINQDR